MVIISVVSIIVVILIVIIGYMLYRKRRQQSLKKDIANLDIEETETKSDKKPIESSKSQKNNRSKSKKGASSKRKGSDVLDIEEEDENTQTKEKNFVINVTSADGKQVVRINDGKRNNNHRTKDILGTDSDDDELSYNDGQITQNKTNRNETSSPTVDIDLDDDDDDEDEM